MEARILLLLAVTAILEFVTFASGKPIVKIPVDPEVEPARESELLVSKYFFPRRHTCMISFIDPQLVFRACGIKFI